MFRNRLFAFATVATVLASSVSASLTLAHPANAPVEITFWHAMGGTNGKAVTTLVTDFNSSHPDIHVTEQLKGASYNELLNNSIAAFQQKAGPNITQIFDLGTALASDSGFFTPVESLLSADQLASVKADVVGPVLGFFTINGKLNSLPWNNSNPLLYINKDMFTAAGLDASKPPATWQELEADCAKILASGVPNCLSLQIYGWPFEQWMALQGQEMANNGNGRAARATATNLDSAAAKNILAFWKDMYNKKYWISSGKLEDGTGAKTIFSSKQAAMWIDSTGSLGGIIPLAQAAGFQLGEGFLPNNADIPRVGIVTGGASLWVAAGRPDAENQATVTFLMWLLAKEQMAKWHQLTGYLPITKSAQTLLTSQGWFDANPGQKVAIDQLNASQSTSATAGGLMGPYPQIRTLVEQAIVAVTSGGADVASTVKDLKAKADQTLADYNNRLGAPATAAVAAPAATMAATMAATAAK